MTEFIQKFLLKNGKAVQYLVNEKLAKGSFLPNFFKWMEIGPRNSGKHVIPKIFRMMNSAMLLVGHRFNWARPHLTKSLFSREREIYMIGYAFIFVLIAFINKKNFLRPLNSSSETFLYHYDNPKNLTKRFGVYVPHHYTQNQVSAHYLEINKIFSREMLKRYTLFEKEVTEEFNSSSEKTKRTKYLENPNYVYEPFGWESSNN